jgi:hypothetical protein
MVAVTEAVESTQAILIRWPAAPTLSDLRRFLVVAYDQAMIALAAIRRTSCRARKPGFQPPTIMCCPSSNR